MKIKKTLVILIMMLLISFFSSACSSNKNFYFGELVNVEIKDNVTHRTVT